MRRRPVSQGGTNADFPVDVAAVAETQRITAARRIYAGRHPDIETQAFRDGWTAKRTEPAVLREQRPFARATVRREGDPMEQVHRLRLQQLRERHQGHFRQLRQPQPGTVSLLPPPQGRRSTSLAVNGDNMTFTVKSTTVAGRNRLTSHRRYSPPRGTPGSDRVP